ncbi:MAG: hypothetical protein J5382_05160 [Bacteroidales bacterium]|nr:hypothetical protein [Bacteroidales bacterium]
MALVFALAGATLMYTGCSKDYTEDINNVKSSVSDLQNKLGELNNELSALKSSVSSLDAAYKAADDLIKGDVTDLKTRVGKVEDAISKAATKEDVAAVEKKLNDLKADIKKTTDDLQKQINDLKTKLAADEEAIKKLQEAQKEVDNVYGFLSDELRGLVFQPDFYLAGVEATSYDFGDFEGWEPYGIPEKVEMEVATDTLGNKTKIVFPKGAKAEARYVAVRDDKGKYVYYEWDPKTNYYKIVDGELVVGNANNGRPLWYADMTQGQVGLATYDMNPSSFPVDSAEWSMVGRDVPYIVKSSEAEGWAPVVNSVVKNEKNQAEVNFSIENPELIYTTVVDAFKDLLAENEGEDEPTPVEILPQALAILAGEPNIADVQLKATLSDGREVSSDWHAVSSGEEYVSHLAFSLKNGYVTENEYDCGQAIVKKEVKVKDLYYDAYDAAENLPSVKVKYNGGPFELADKIDVHTYDVITEDVNIYTLAEFNKKYPEYHYEFELVPYTIGNNVTSEEMYGKIDGTTFIPCYVESVGGKPKSIEIEKDSEDGISSVSRMPIVLVYLVNNETGYSYAVGYFKILIDKDAREPETRTFEIPGLGKVPFICGPFTLSTNWHEFSYFVLENLKVEYAEFIKNYEFKGIWGYENVDAKGKVELVEIVKAAPGDTVDLKYNDPKLKKEVNYGKAAYTQDKSGTGINDAFTWTVAPQDIGQGNSKSIYFRFESGAYDIVYFEMKADVAAAAKYDFGANKIANEWYDDIDGEAKNTTRINVLVPNKTDDDVTDFYRDLNRFFIGYKPSMVLTADSDPVYANYFDKKADKTKYDPAELEGNFTFYFADEQPAINGVQLYTNYWSTSDTLYVAQYEKKNGKDVMVEQTVKVDGKDVKVPAIIDTNVIAFFDTTAIKYYYKDGEAMSKTLLNLWSYTQTDQAKMLYANILVKTTYGECEIPAGDNGFHVRFVRPLDVNFDHARVAEESAVAGFNVLLAQCLNNITDWNKQAVIKITKDKNGKVTKVEPNVIAGVDMYKYYQFKKIILDLDNAERDNFKIDAPTEKGLLKDVTPDAHLALGTVDKDGVFTDGGTNEIDIQDISKLLNAAINYRNDRAVVETFNLYIPIAIEYAWGTINEVLVIEVKPTSGTTPHSL